MSRADETAVAITGESGPMSGLKETAIRSVFFSCALVTVLTTLGIILVLVQGSVGFFQEVSIVEYFTGTDWSPVIQPRSFGVLPLIWGTLIITVGSALIAIPVGTATAASNRLGRQSRAKSTSR